MLYKGSPVASLWILNNYATMHELRKGIVVVVQRRPSLGFGLDVSGRHFLS
jgi:hypothetical protein